MQLTQIQQSPQNDEQSYKSFMQPTWENTIAKREAYGVSLRKKKREQILTNKRLKIAEMIEEQQNKEKWLSDEDVQILKVMNEEVEAKEGECDYTTKIDAILSNLLQKAEKGSKQLKTFIQNKQKSSKFLQKPQRIWQHLPQEYLKQATLWMQYLRLQLHDVKFFQGLILDTQIVFFMKLNFEIFCDFLGQNEFSQNHTNFLVQLTWLLPQLSMTSDAQLLMKIFDNTLVVSQLISIPHDIFPKFYSKKQNQEIVENVLWFYSNLVEENPLIVKETCFFETIENISKIPGKVDVQRVINMSWFIQNISQDSAYLLQLDEEMFYKIVKILNRMILKNDHGIAGCHDPIVMQMGNSISNLLQGYQESEYFTYLLGNFDLIAFLQRCLQQTQIGPGNFIFNNILNGVKIYGQILSHNDESISKKACQSLPKILELIEFNILCHQFDVFDPNLEHNDFQRKCEIYVHTFWTLSNIAICESYQFQDTCLITKDLYSQVINIATSAQAQSLNMLQEDTDSMKATALKFTKFKNIFTESMFVITQCLNSAQDEAVFQGYNDSRIPQLLLACLDDKKKLLQGNHRLVYHCLCSLERVLNFDMYSDTAVGLREIVLNNNGRKILENLLEHDHPDIQEKAQEIFQEYLEGDEDEQGLEDHNQTVADNGKEYDTFKI